MFPVPASEPRVPPRWSDITIPGLPVSQVQFFRLFALEAGVDAPQEHVIINAQEQQLDKGACDRVAGAVRAIYPEASIACWVMDEPGRAVVASLGPADAVAFA